MDISNREILQSMIERKAEVLINSVDGMILPLFNGNPAIGKMAQSFITAKKKDLLPKIQEYCDLLVETSCIDPEVTLNDAVINAENMLNEFITQIVGNKLGVPAGTVNISLQVLFGEDLFKL